ncbi:uncharacterized protein LOC102699913 isoform X2 [Oryza brachyantha]|nr:uncharacterized protein LOC102699913 isoform X2 [Oryza brachyantha]
MMAVRSLRLLGEPHMAKVSIKHLLRFRGMSTADNLAMQLKSYPRHVRKLPRWIREAQEPRVHTRDDIFEHVMKMSSEFKLLCSESMQIQIFEEEIKPFLVSRCLLCPVPMGSRLFKEMHQMIHGTTHQFPHYLTSKTLMRILMTRSRMDWRAILECLVSQRVMVMLDWVNELSIAEVLFYDHGLLLAPQSGALHDQTVYKGECDACYHKPLKSDSTTKGEATVASVIWKTTGSSADLLECQVIKGLSCNSSEHAEAIGLLGLLTRGKELGIKKFDVVTDNEGICNIMMGKRDVCSSKNADTCMAAIQTAKYYETLKCRWEPREMIDHVNDIARAVHMSNTDDLQLTVILESKSSQFWGKPFLRVKQGRKETEDRLGKWKINQPPAFATNEYYMKVQSKLEKTDSFEGLLDVIDSDLILVLASDVSAQEVLTTLGADYCLSIWESGALVHETLGTTDRRAHLLINHNSVIPLFAASKCLMIVYDNPPHSIQYHPDQDVAGVKCVHIVEPGNKSHSNSIPCSAQEVDPFLYGFFQQSGN